jgi:predicted nucleic acid-binding protein
MNGKVFVDTNVLVYLFDRDAPTKQKTARTILEIEGPAGRIVISTQVLQEFYVSVTRKLAKPLSEQEAESAVRDLATLDVVQVDVDMVVRSIATARAHHLSLWDALIIEAAQSRGCRRVLSEDLQYGRQFGALTIENPFKQAVG